MVKKSLEIDIKLGHLEGIGANYGTLGNIFRRKKLGGAEEMFKKALTIEEKLGILKVWQINMKLGIVLGNKGTGGNQKTC
jgi:hypothetical protein